MLLTLKYIFEVNKPRPFYAAHVSQHDKSYLIDQPAFVSCRQRCCLANKSLPLVKACLGHLDKFSHLRDSERRGFLAEIQSIKENFSLRRGSQTKSGVCVYSPSSQSAHFGDCGEIPQRSSFQFGVLGQASKRLTVALCLR